MSRRSLAFLGLLTLSLIGSACAGDPTPSGMPTKHMVTSANPFASDAGLEILRRGGSAVDAATAVQMVLTLVEPQSSGIGGGAFMLHYDDNSKTLEAYDGRETAPSEVDSTLFLTDAGTPASKRDVIPGGRSAGAPGVIRMLALAHGEHGALPWKDLFDPAIRLASEGFPVSPRLREMVSKDQNLKKFKASRDYFYGPDGEAWPVGHVLKNPALAATLRLIAREGPEVFYRGEIAREIVAAVRGSEINPGRLSADDIAGYQPKKRDVVCAPYRAWRICGMPPPSSGGVAVIQILKTLEGDAVAALEPETAEAANLIAEAARLAYADRATYLADSDFVDVPIDALVDGKYLAGRRALIEPGSVMASAPAGKPLGKPMSFRTAEPSEVPATTHYSIVDGMGNVVALTSSVESAFGNRMMVRGFMLNNQLTDFTFAPEKDGLAVANRVEAGKRPLSSMSPTIVFDAEGRPVITLGSPGGPLIISFVAKTLIGVLDWGMGIQEAINLSNYIHFGNALYVERGSALAAKSAELEALGYVMTEGALTSGLHGVVIHYQDDGSRWLEGGADPRREGKVSAD